MTLEQMVGLGLALVVMGIGLLGTILPALPGAPLIFIAAIGHRLYFRDAGASNSVLAVLLVLTILSLVLDYLATLFGAKKMGASWKGITGAMVGAIVGLFFAPIGIFLGPFLGALGFELLGGRGFSDASRAGAGALIGLLAGAVGKLACCVVMIALFTVNVMGRSGAVPAVPAVAVVSSAQHW
jgi:uncharacterized protein